MPLNKKHKQRIQQWVDALRNGQYRQTSKALCRIEKGVHRYCCLGVACEVAIANGVKIKTREDSTFIEGKVHERKVKCVLYDNMGDFLPNKVYKWFGLDAANPKVTIGHRDCLSIFNDDRVGFKKIADAIEKEFLL